MHIYIYRQKKIHNNRNGNRKNKTNNLFIICLYAKEQTNYRGLYLYMVLRQSYCCRFYQCLKGNVGALASLAFMCLNIIALRDIIPLGKLQLFLLNDIPEDIPIHTHVDVIYWRLLNIIKMLCTHIAVARGLIIHYDVHIMHIIFSLFINLNMYSIYVEN